MSTSYYYSKYVFQCKVCLKLFDTQRALSIHSTISQYCADTLDLARDIGYTIQKQLKQTKEVTPLQQQHTSLETQNSNTDNEINIFCTELVESSSSESDIALQISNDV